MECGVKTRPIWGLAALRFQSETWLDCDCTTMSSAASESQGHHALWHIGPQQSHSFIELPTGPKTIFSCAELSDHACLVAQELESSSPEHSAPSVLPLRTAQYLHYPAFTTPENSLPSGALERGDDK